MVFLRRIFDDIFWATIPDVAVAMEYEHSGAQVWMTFTAIQKCSRGTDIKMDSNSKINLSLL